MPISRRAPCLSETVNTSPLGLSSSRDARSIVLFLGAVGKLRRPVLSVPRAPAALDLDRKAAALATVCGAPMAEAPPLYILRHPGEDRTGRDGLRHAPGQTAAGRYLHVIDVPDEEGGGVFIVTAYEIRGKPRRAYKRRRRR
jgi:hypothetical protein